ncbi:hypothetical protein SK128_017353 [Halocaridina rubra]|uniref:Uncharacterized protein n=1 Tax=Halocaridina rubra TaxID=373956 RepID=A0AAN8WLI3_HALRR
MFALPAVFRHDSEASRKAPEEIQKYREDLYIRRTLEKFLEHPSIRVAGLKYRTVSVLFHRRWCLVSEYIGRMNNIMKIPMKGFLPIFYLLCMTCFGYVFFLKKGESVRGEERPRENNENKREENEPSEDSVNKDEFQQELQNHIESESFNGKNEKQIRENLASVEDLDEVVNKEKEDPNPTNTPNCPEMENMNPLEMMQQLAEDMEKDPENTKKELRNAVQQFQTMAGTDVIPGFLWDMMLSDQVLNNMMGEVSPNELLLTKVIIVAECYTTDECSQNLKLVKAIMLSRSSNHIIHEAEKDGQICQYVYS